jgi:zinc finger protein
MSKKSKQSEEQFSFICPVCKEGNVLMQKTIYELPDKDQMLIIKFECNQCNFTTNDIIPLTTNFEPGIKILKIENEEDLKSKIYRSPVATLEIPELELVVEPGPAADFYYTNIEGILLRFQDAVSIYKKGLQKNDAEMNEIEEILNNIEKALRGEFKFTLKITDTGGGSYIIPQDESHYSFIAIENQDTK